MLDLQEIAPALTGNRRLPTQPTPLFGREEQAAALCARLRDPDVRLVTLLGPAGVGKTRLALYAAERLASSFAEVGFVDLAAVDEEAPLLPAIAGALGRPAPADWADPRSLATSLGEQPILLILDNCEHVAALAPELAMLLGAGPQLTVLATSRVALRLRWEHLFQLEPLPVPESSAETSPQALAASPAAALFVERVQAVRPDFRLTPDTAPAVAALCRRLDGLPLALELAAAQCLVLSPSALVDALDRPLDLLASAWADAPARQRSLRAAFAWSVDRLPADEAALFRRFAVFREGATLEAITDICLSVDGADQPFPLSLLVSLVSQSLLLRIDADGGETRFRLLEPLRAFAWERLRDADEHDTMADCHARYYLAFAERMEPCCHEKTPEAMCTLGQVERELGNLRAARDWFAKQQAADEGLRLAAALGPFFLSRGYYSEGQRWLQEAIAAGRSAAAEPRHLAAALLAAGRTAEHQGDYVLARSATEESVRLYRQLDERSALAAALGWHACVSGDMLPEHEVWALLQESQAIYRDLGDRSGEAKVLNISGELARLRGDYEQAATRYQESLALYRDIEHQGGVAMLHHNLGYVAQHHLEYAQAVQLFSEGLSLYRAMGNTRLLAVCLAALAAVAMIGQPEQAARLFAAAEAHLERIGAAMERADRLEHERNVAAVRASLGEQTFHGAWSEGRAMTLEQALASIEAAIRQHAPGQSTAPRAEPSVHAEELTPREREVAMLVARGLTNRQIAARLVIAERTVDKHVGNILGKLGFASRAQVAAWTVEQGLQALHATLAASAMGEA